MNFQMMRVISSPSNSTTGFATFIFNIENFYDYKCRIFFSWKKGKKEWKIENGKLKVKN